MRKQEESANREAIKPQILSEYVHRTIEFFLKRHFWVGRILHTLEIGYSSATPLFEHSAAVHWCLVDAPTKSHVSSAFPAKFVICPFPQLASHIPDKRLDIVFFGTVRRASTLAALFDEILPKLTRGAIVVFPGLRLPSRYDTYKKVFESGDFYTAASVLDTEFLAYYPAVSHEGSTDAISQCYEAQRYPLLNPFAYTVPFRLPCMIDYDRPNSNRPLELKRGFRLSGSQVLSEGRSSLIVLPLESADVTRLEIKISVKPMHLDKRPGAAVVLRVGANDVTVHEFTGPNAMELLAEADMPDDGELTIELINSGLVPIALDGSGDAAAPLSQPGVELLSVKISAAGSPQAHAGALRRHQGSIASFSHKGQSYRFFVDDPHDSIQAYHNVGQLYEIEELDLIERHVPKGAEILDVGANIGNHTAYFAKALAAKRIVAIELLERAVNLLRLNVALNELATVDLSRLGVGLGVREEKANINIPQSFNPAGAQFKVNSEGSYRIVPGDELLAADHFDFIKIDVEGMECDVIGGMSGLISRSAPILFVEVWNENRARFDQIMGQLGYRLEAEYRRYDVATNLLMKPTALRAHDKSS